MTKRFLFTAFTLLRFASAEQEQSQPSWHRLSTNINYRLSAIFDVNGGADRNPSFKSSHARTSDSTTDANVHNSNSQKKSPGYSIPIEVVTIYDPNTNDYHQRVSYYGGMAVDYNVNGVGYRVILKPFGWFSDVSSQSVCLYNGGGENKLPFLNFFPTEDHMMNYTVGELVTSEPGIPYRVATLESSHGSFDAETSTEPRLSTSYTRDGMPPDDLFQFNYEESLSFKSQSGVKNFVRPLKWTMLSRNQIINAHTEDWVLRYSSYEPIDTEEERKLWSDWFQLSLKKDCPENSIQLQGSSGLQFNRLGMFLSSSSTVNSHEKASKPSRFDLFLSRHNKYYTSTQEYFKRKSIHDMTAENIDRWNLEHAGKTSFVPNEFMDLEVSEVLHFRGGHKPLPRKRSTMKSPKKFKLRNFPQSADINNDGDEYDDDDSAYDDDDADDGDEYNYTLYQLPLDFDPSTLPKQFDWRSYLPDSVGPIKDQGFCGSCWAFSFISALESHWYIANAQSVVLPEQFVNDCTWSQYTQACNGGLSSIAASIIIEKFGGRVPIEDVYGKYISIDGQCYVDILESVGMLNATSPEKFSTTVKLLDWVVLPSRDDVTVKHALLNKGPLSVAFNVVPESVYYASGVLDVESCTANKEYDTGHAINLVGWGVDTLPDGTESEHWILRNSWSTLWGDMGYIKVRMGERDCGVTASVGFPVVAKVDGKSSLTDLDSITEYARA